MIERFYLKNFLSFQEVQLELQNALVVFSGPSGSGKSILMKAVLSSFGLTICDAALCESSVTWKLDEESGIENEEINIFKQVKKEKTRYFINAQSVPKKMIASLSAKHLRHLSLKDYSDFENNNLLDILDSMAAKRDALGVYRLKEELKETFVELEKVKKELYTIEDEEKRIVELKEFTRFEIEKIEKIDPKPGEYEELFTIKKELSKKEKALEAIQRAFGIFEMEHAVSEALDLLEEESAFFDDVMNELRSRLESADERFAALEEVSIEEILDRLESLSELKRKYGSIEEAVQYLQKKKEELQKYENIAFEKEELSKKVVFLQKRLDELANRLHEYRQQGLPSFERKLNELTSQLYLGDVDISLESSSMSVNGYDTVSLRLSDTDLNKVSTGEFNRLRLAVLAVKSDFMEEEGSVLMLDEIDANLSGEESMSVAKVLRKLSKRYQIFVISHQPQLTSQGEQHFFVYKDEEGISHVKELDRNERIEEIARIISGDTIAEEAIEFARKLLDSAKNRP